MSSQIWTTKAYLLAYETQWYTKAFIWTHLKIGENIRESSQMVTDIAMDMFRSTTRWDIRSHVADDVLSYIINQKLSKSSTKKDSPHLKTE